MSWVVLAGGAALFYAVQGAWTKRLTGRVTPATATWAIFAFSFPALAAYLALTGIPQVGGRFWPVLAVNVALGLLSFYLYVSAIQRGDLGITYPLLALTPILVVPVEWIVLGERAGVRGVAGILLVVAGVYLLNFVDRHAPLLEPFRALARDRGARRMMAVTVIWAISGTLDRVAVLEASPGLYGAALSGALGLGFLPFAWRSGRGDRDVSDGPAGTGDPEGSDEAAGRRLPGALAHHAPGLLLQGLLFAALFICQMEALRLSLAAYVLSIKRSGVLLTVLLGALFFGERRLGRRLAGTVVILAGVFLVAGS